MLDWPAALDAAPHAPGVYTYTDAHGKILYIGKAKDLRKRLAHYATARGADKTALMLKRAHAVTWVVTRTEVEALLLEANRIRTEKPPYNIDLKENVRYAHLRLTAEPFPRLITVRDPRGVPPKDLFGPFADGAARAELARLARKLFRLRVCRTMPKRVCLYYHLGLCSGPCEGKIAADAYSADVERARRFLRGQTPELAAELEREMTRASDDLRFEDAKRLRDTLRGVRSTAARQAVVREKRYDEDVVLLRQRADDWLALVLHAKRGVITGTEEYPLATERVGDAPLDGFLLAYYADHDVPRELLLEHEPVDPALEGYLRERAGHPVRVAVPSRGERHALLDIARRNAAARVDGAHAILLALQDALRLPGTPRRIDAFDISHTGGTATVGASVRFTDTTPEKSAYRAFTIRGAGNDDFAAIAECVTRRYKTAADLPDLLLIDGGKGQLGAAYDALRARGFAVPVIGLAKRDEEVFVPGLPTPLPIDRASDASRFLQRVRDEIHRFVLSRHRVRRTRTTVRTALLDIPGIGPATAAKLLRRFGSVAGVLAADDGALAQVLNARQITTLRTHHSPKGTNP